MRQYLSKIIVDTRKQAWHMGQEDEASHTCEYYDDIFQISLSCIRFCLSLLYSVQPSQILPVTLSWRGAC